MVQRDLTLFLVPLSNPENAFSCDSWLNLPRFDKTLGACKADIPGLGLGALGEIPSKSVS
jgi:hypothetical protein